MARKKVNNDVPSYKPEELNGRTLRLTKFKGMKSIPVGEIDAFEIYTGPPERGAQYKDGVTGAFVKKIGSAAVLWESALRYFQWVDENPWTVYEAIKSGDRAGEQAEIFKKRPYTADGMQIFLGISDTTWRKYRSDEGYEEFHEVMALIEKIIRNNKYEGAAIGAFNPNLMVRDLGLADKKDTNLTGTLEHTITGMEIK